MFIKIEFILGKDLERVKELFQKFWLTHCKYGRHNWYLMLYRRYRRRRYRKYKLKRKHKIRGWGIFTDTLKIFGSALSRAWGR